MQDYKTSKYILDLANKYPGIARQFFYSKKEDQDKINSSNDPFYEDKNSPVKGLVHVYPNRALILLTHQCALFCRFCMRRRKTKTVCPDANLNEKDFMKIVSYIRKKAGIKEVILSGGDPLFVPDLLKKAVIKLSSLKQVKIIRISTRIPIVDPGRINNRIIQALKPAKNKSVYITLHINHPAELTGEAKKAVKKLQALGAIILSQSVLLRKVNDKVEILEELFNKLLEAGIKPYYLFQCDPVRGTSHFTVDLNKGIRIYTALRKRLSGLACPLYTIEAPMSRGKVPIPADFWNFDRTFYKDFNGKRIKLS